MRRVLWAGAPPTGDRPVPPNGKNGTAKPRPEMSGE